MSIIIIVKKTRKFIEQWALPSAAAGVLLASTCGAFADTNTSLPFSDTFETYPSGTSLDTGTNGWYGSSSNIIVQTDTVRSGTKAAMLPVDCTLSNRFQGIAVTDVWVQMDARPCLYDGTNVPIVDTNVAAFFYVDSNGHFVVHNGPATNPSPTNSLSWVVATNNVTMATNGTTWVRINILEKFSSTNWDLYADGVLVTNNVGFINTGLTNFTGFNVYNGSLTSYLDNVSVSAINTNTATQRPLIVLPPVPAIRNYFIGDTPSVQTVKVYNVWDAAIGFQLTTNQYWIAAVPANGNVAAGTTQNVTVTYGSTAGWQAGSSNATVTVVATNGTDFWNTQTVALVVNVMQMQATPTNITNAVWLGEIPSNQTFNVNNLGGGSFSYTTQTGTTWVSCSPAGGTVGAASSNTVTLIYSNTAGWAAGVSSSWVRVVSSDSIGATQTVNLTLNVLNVQANMSVSPTLLSNMVWVGGTPTNNRTFEIRNSGGCPLNFTAALTSSCPWITDVQASSGTVAANGTNVITVSYGSTAGWTAGASSNATIRVVSTNGGGATQDVSVVLSVQSISNSLDVAPANLTNGVVLGSVPLAQSFEVRNLSDANFTYGVATGVTWLASSTTGGLLTARGTSTVTLTYGSTAGWPTTPAPRTSNGTVTVTSGDGGGATKAVGVTLYLYGSGITNTIPFTDNFEQYTNLTPLVGGINGWYGSATQIVVQQSVVRSGLQAAMIPVDCILSNPFQSVAATNVWVQMDLRPSLYDGSNNPVVDTNAAVMFYVNSNGNFVVHNGPASDPTNSVNWVVATNVGIGTNGTNWVTVGIYEDFTKTNWDLYANGALVTNNIGFIKTSLTNFVGFDVYNGSGTSYVDNVMVRAPGTVTVAPTNLNCRVMAGTTASNLTFVITAQTGAWNFVNTTSATWLAVSPVAGIVDAAVGGTNVTVLCGTPAGNSYTGTVTVTATNADGVPRTNMVVVTLDVMDLQVASATNLTNSIMLGGTPGDQSITLTNAGGGTFNYTVTNAQWLSGTSTNGTLGPRGGVAIPVKYASTAGWISGTSNGTIRVASTDGGGKTQDVAVTLNVMELIVTPTNITSSVWQGDKPANQAFIVKNAGGGSFAYTTETNAFWITCSSNGGTAGSNNLTLSYASTAGWAPGVSSAWVRVASSAGGGATQMLYVTLNVSNAQASMSVSPTLLSNTVWVGGTPTNNRTFEVRNSGGNALNFSAAVTSSCPWITDVQVTPGTVAAGGTNVMTVSYGSTAGWLDGASSNATIRVVSTNGVGATQLVSVVLSVQSISNSLDVAPVNLINGVVLGYQPSNQSFEVRNLSDANFTYGVATGVTWLASSTTGGLLTARGTSTVTLTYGSTAGWPTTPAPRTSNGTVTVTSGDGGGATKAVGVTLYLYGSGITNTIPFDDDFEQYTNLTPLVGGINGWYGSSTQIVVQQSVVRSGLQAAMIPVDCILSNPFQSVAATNVWVQMDLRPSLYDGSNNPVVTTNATIMFYVNSNGNFVVHNGPAPDPTNSANWVVTTNGGVGTNGTNWVTVGIYEDFTKTNWDLYANGVLVTNNIGFVDPSLTNFTGFNVYNGSNTSYVDNVHVRAPGTIAVNPTSLYYKVMLGRTPSNQNVVVTAQTGAWNFVNTTSATWLAVSPVTGIVSSVLGGTNVTVMCATQSVGSYTGVVTVSATNSDGVPRTQTVTVNMDVMDLQVSPTNLTNSIMAGGTPTTQSFSVTNAGEGAFNYTVTNTQWLSGTSTNGSLGPHSGSLITVRYANTAGWNPGISNGTILVTSSDGGGTTQSVAVTLNVMRLTLIPQYLTNSVMAGGQPTNQSFIVTNEGGGTFNYTVTNTQWLSGTSTNGTLGSYSGSVVTVRYAPTTGWLPGVSNGTITVASSDFGGATQTVAVTLNLMGMDVNPTNFSNTVMVGWAPPPQTGQVINLGAGSYAYAITVTNNWLSCAPTSGTINAYGTNTYVVTYSNTTAWTPLTTSNTTILISSADGGGTSRMVNVALTILPRATNFYVSTNGLGIAPYTNWVIAATNLQDAVNAADSNGDHVLVSNGVFTLTNQVVVSNGVIIEGVFGRDQTFINGNYPATLNRCALMSHSNALMQGFTISNGCAGFGGGIYLTNGATVRDCIIAGNIATNPAPAGGGGLYVGSLSTVSNCVIYGNASAGLGGGLILDNATASNCRFSNNVSTEASGTVGGGGVTIRNGSTLRNSAIISNTAARYGGGVLLGSSGSDTSRVWNCTIASNTAANGGGGLAVVGGLVRNCLIFNNSAATNGAGIYLNDGATAAIENSTIITNANAGVYAHSNAVGYLENCIVVSNAIAVNGASVGFTNCSVESTNSLIGSGNITNDPVFVSFIGRNYRLNTLSPCINTGTNRLWMTTENDLDGNPRLIGPSVDMGAYENPLCWMLTPVALTNQVMVDLTPSNQGFAVINWGSDTLNYNVTTNAPWVMSSSNIGTLGPYVTNALVLSYAATTGWTPGTSNALVTVVVTNSLSLMYPPQTQTVAVVMNIMQMETTPTALTIDIMKGLTATQTFNVANLGNGLLAYAISTNTYDWVGVNPDNGVLTNTSTNTITVTYAPTLPDGVTTGLLTVASSSGGGATQTVALTVTVMELQRTPGGLTNEVIPGYTPTPQAFTMWNGGAGTFNYTISSDASWVTLVPNSGTLGAYATNAIAVIYSATTGWLPGTSNATVTIVSTNGGGATQTVAIAIHVTALLPPSGVAASKGTYADKVSVTWDVVTNATGYQVWRNTVDNTATATNLGALAVTSYDDTTAVTEVVYYYWIKSTNSLGESAFSASDTGYRSLGAPPAPTGLIASKGTYTDRVALSWTASATAVGYEIWRSTSSDSNTAEKVSNPDPVGTSYADTAATNAVLYSYWVKAKGSNNTTSAFSSSDTGWRAVPSPAVSATKGLRREVKVTWTASPGAARYELWKNIVNESSSAELVTTIDTTSYRDTLVLPGITFYYWVRALCSLGDSGMGSSGEGWCNGGKWDFNGDGRAEVWYYNEQSGRWYIKLTDVLSTTILGGPGWKAVPADYDGDGITDIAVYEAASGTWQARLSGRGGELVAVTGFGRAGYVAVVGDYDGDGKADPAIYSEPSGAWSVALSGSGYQLAGVSGFGMSGYSAVPADFDGDGKTDPAVYEEASGNWLMALSGNGYQMSYVLGFGQRGYTPVPGEYQGLGYSQIAVYHAASGNWYIRTGPGELAVVFFGQTGYVPMPADYDGDKYEDECVFYRSRHDAVWYLLKSTEGFEMISGRSSRP